MKFLRVAVALALTILMLVVARGASRGKPEHIAQTQNGYGLDMITVPKFAENSRAHLDFTITGPLSWDVQPILRYARSERDSLRNFSAYHMVPLIQADSTTGKYFTELSTGPRGGRLQYYIEVVDQRDQVLASFMMPNGKPFVLKYFGDVPSFVLVSHIVFIFATVFCIAMAATHAISVIRGAIGPATMLGYLLWGVIFTLVGGYPFGFAMNWYAFGGIWEGVPFGTDATDNKTQLLLVYLLFATLVGLGTLTRGIYGRDVFRPALLGWFGLGSLFVMLFIYLIPHSIQFSASLTYTFCYSFIGFWALVYLVGWLTSRRSQPEYEHRRPPQRVAR